MALDDNRPGREECPYARCLRLASAVVSFGCPLFDGAEKSSSGHLAGHSESDQHASGALEYGDRDSSPVGEAFTRGGHASAGVVIRKPRHCHCDSVDTFGINAVFLACLDTRIGIEKMSNLVLPLCSS
ncbi:hypothetical protein [Rhodococcus triatomae]